MIIAKMQGGLGNQMFQYAFGRSLAQKEGSELALDCSYYEAYLPGIGNVRKMLRDAKHAIRGKLYGYKPPTAHLFKLDKFRIKASVLDSSAYAEVMKKIGSGEIASVKENGYEFDQAAAETKGDAYLDGFWQSEKYFSGIGNDIRRDLTLAQPYGSNAQSISNEIKSCESVSLHVRRTDYLIGSSFGPCSPEYYSKAVEIIGKRVENPCIFVFSDDIEWSKKNIKTGLPQTFVSSKGVADYEELMLMAQCRHNITANSSFSWWGAWLNANPQKTVVTPKIWFKKEKLNTKSRVPDSWIKA